MWAVDSHGCIVSLDSLRKSSEARGPVITNHVLPKAVSKLNSVFSEAYVMNKLKAHEIIIEAQRNIIDVIETRVSGDRLKCTYVIIPILNPRRDHHKRS